MTLTYEYLGMGPTPSFTDYQDVWDHQRRVHAEVADGIRPGHVIFNQHMPVYTAGRRTEPHERPKDGTPVVDVDRGGKITYHGPGQLVGYPIVQLADGVGVVDHVRRMEGAIIELLESYGLRPERIEGRTGVWFAGDATRPDRKICAIGVRVSRRTTMHGFALNVQPSNSYFDNIVPCGISDAGVTSLAEELAGSWTVEQVAHDLEPILTRHLADEIPRTGSDE